MISKYEIIKPPFNAIFGSMDKEHTKLYFEWFMEQIPHRVDILCSYVRSTDEFKDWSPDFQSQSLLPLGKWFCEQVTSRPRTEQEIAKIAANSPAWFKSNFDIPSDELPNETFSLSIDIGMYFGRTLEKNLPDLIWQPLLKQKNNIYYQQPIIVGKGKAQLNPVWIVKTYAYGILQEINGPERLLELYDVWAGLLSD